MRLTIEIATLLKSVPIFSQVPRDLLLQLASEVHELHVPAGSNILTKGELGTTMFIIAQGRLLVHDEKREIAELGRGDVVGELSALDPELRTADATALEDCVVFRLSEDQLYEIMAEDIEVVRGIMRVLIRRHRSAIGEGQKGHAGEH